MLDPNTTTKSVLALWDQRGRLSESLLQIRRKLARSACTVVVFGAGGVGKTTLGRLLSPDFDQQTPPHDYKESFEPETYWLKTNPVRSIVVAPGQESRVEAYWPELYASLSRAKRSVVVYVAAYGYHALSTEKTIIDGASAVDQYLEEARAREIELFGEVVGYLGKTTFPLKLITLVTKQDLWYDDREEVRRHYESGPHAALLERIRSAKGAQHFAHEFVYACLALHNLKTGDGKTIALTTAGYDDAVRSAGQKQLLDVLGGFVK